MRQAEKEDGSADEALRLELRQIKEGVRSAFTLLAQLYDLRISGGVAHRENSRNVKDVARSMGLSSQRWRRADLILLLGRLTCSVKSLMQLLRYGVTQSRSLT